MLVLTQLAGLWIGDLVPLSRQKNVFAPTTSVFWCNCKAPKTCWGLNTQALPGLSHGAVGSEVKKMTDVANVLPGPGATRVVVVEWWTGSQWISYIPRVSPSFSTCSETKPARFHIIFHHVRNCPWFFPWFFLWLAVARSAGLGKAGEVLTEQLGETLEQAMTTGIHCENHGENPLGRHQVEKIQEKIVKNP